VSQVLREEAYTRSLKDFGHAIEDRLPTREVIDGFIEKPHQIEDLRAVGLH
jgi:hypothetical protein